MKGPAKPPPTTSSDRSRRFARAVLRARVLWIVGALALAACLGPYATRVVSDDDVLAFLPPQDETVVALREVSATFGLLDVAVIGLAANDGDTLLQPERVEHVRTLAQALARVDGVQQVLAFPDLPTLEIEGETLVVRPLVPKNNPTADLAAHVLGNPFARGALVANDGAAAAVLVSLPAAREQRSAVLASIRAATASIWPWVAHFGGAPFIEAEAAGASRSDLARLSPIVVLVLGLGSALLLRSVWAAALNLAMVGLSLLCVLGVHTLLDVRLSIVSSTLPVLLVALGGAFGMHMLAAFASVSGTAKERAEQALQHMVIPIVLSAITTALSLAALAVMPQRPMQVFAVTGALAVLFVLALTLTVLPAALSFAPPRMRPVHFALTVRPRRTTLFLLGCCGWAGLWALHASPDTRDVFDATSPTRRAEDFLAHHFGGSTFAQVAISADLSEPVVLRRLAWLRDDLARIKGVVDVRSLLEPVALVNEGFGGRAGVPETQGRARRVLGQLADQPAMAQVLTRDVQGTVMHVRLAGDASIARVTTALREVVFSHFDEPSLGVASTARPEVALRQREDVVEHLAARTPWSIAAIKRALPVSDQLAADAWPQLERLRARAFGGDEIIEPLLPAVYEALPLERLMTHRGEALAREIAAFMPTLAERDAEGVNIAAQQLTLWVDEARLDLERESFCRALQATHAQCEEVAPWLGELHDAWWQVPVASAERTLDVKVWLTGQPFVGQAFARSVMQSLRISTLLTLLALALTLLLSRMLATLTAAVWGLGLTLGVLAVMGHNVSVSTSMITCIAAGAGVDFAIHLALARTRPGEPARVASVVLLTGVQLALAFSVLLASSMPPLRSFGAGLAVALAAAALGAILFREPPHVAKGAR